MMQLGASLVGKFISFSPNATFLKDEKMQFYFLAMDCIVFWSSFTSKLLLTPIAWDLYWVFHATTSLEYYVPDKAKQTFEVTSFLAVLSVYFWRWRVKSIVQCVCLCHVTVKSACRDIGVNLKLANCQMKKEKYTLSTWQITGPRRAIVSR